MAKWIDCVQPWAKIPHKNRDQRAYFNMGCGVSVQNGDDLSVALGKSEKGELNLLTNIFSYHLTLAHLQQS